jgi:hypothetical protein
MSNPPKDIAEAASDFWNPKPMMASAKAKPQNATGEAKTMPAAVKSKEKPPQ